MIKIKSVKTKYGSYTIGDIINNDRYKKLNDRYKIWLGEQPTYKDGKYIAFYHDKFEFTEQEYDVVDTIEFYQEENKFIISSKNNIIAEIKTTEYAVVVE